MLMEMWRVSLGWRPVNGLANSFAGGSGGRFISN